MPTALTGSEFHGLKIGAPITVDNGEYKNSYIITKLTPTTVKILQFGVWTENRKMLRLFYSLVAATIPYWIYAAFWNFM